MALQRELPTRGREVHTLHFLRHHEGLRHQPDVHALTHLLHPVCMTCRIGIPTQEMLVQQVQLLRGGQLCKLLTCFGLVLSRVQEAQRNLPDRLARLMTPGPILEASPQTCTYAQLGLVLGVSPDELDKHRLEVIISRLRSKVLRGTGENLPLLTDRNQGYRWVPVTEARGPNNGSAKVRKA